MDEPWSIDESNDDKIIAVISKSLQDDVSNEDYDMVDSEVPGFESEYNQVPDSIDDSAQTNHPQFRSTNINWRIAFNKIIFPSTPQIIVDTSIEGEAMYIGYGTIVNSLQLALELARDGFKIQIRRGCKCTELGQVAFEFRDSVWIYGESEAEYLMRMYNENEQESSPLLNTDVSYLLSYRQFNSRIPAHLQGHGIVNKNVLIPPRAIVEAMNNSAIVSISPIILSNLIIKSGHDCRQCDPNTLIAFSAITAEHLLIVEDCHVVAFQGTGILLRGYCNARIDRSTIEGIYYCLFSELGEDCVPSYVKGSGNLMAMNSKCAIGGCELKGQENVYDESRRW